MPNQYVKTQTTEERFWSKVDATGDCWVWTARRHPQGYGEFQLGGRKRNAVHVAWELLVGPCPEGLVPDHLCRNEPCVNIGNHIEWVTPEENTHRGYGVAAVNARKTECKQGHPYSPQNTYIRKDGSRSCRRCAVIWSTRYQSRGRNLALVS